MQRWYGYGGIGLERILGETRYACAGAAALLQVFTIEAQFYFHISSVSLGSTSGKHIIMLNPDPGICFIHTCPCSVLVSWCSISSLDPNSVHAIAARDPAIGVNDSGPRFFLVYGQAPRPDSMMQRCHRHLRGTGKKEKYKKAESALADIFCSYCSC